MAKSIEFFGEGYADGYENVRGIHHALVRQLTRDYQPKPKTRPSHPYAKGLLVQGLEYKVGHVDLFSKEHWQGKFIDAYFTLLHGGAYVQDRRWARRIEKARVRGDGNLDWSTVAELSQPNILDIPLSNLGKDILPRGRTIIRDNNPFMEAFFDDNGFLLRQIACAVTAADPEKMRVLFATRPAGFVIRPETRFVTELAPLTPGRSDLVGQSDFDRQALRNSDVRNLCNGLYSGVRYANWGTTEKPPLLFAEAYTGGGGRVGFEFIPEHLLGQMPIKQGQRRVRYNEFYATAYGGIRSRLVVRDVFFEQVEEFVGVHFPKGRIDVSWDGKRRVTNSERDTLMKDLMARYHNGDTIRLNGYNRNGKST